MSIHKEGIPSIVIAIVIAATLFYIAAYPLHQVPFLPYLFYAGGFFVLVAVLQFFRKPKRNFIKDDDLVIAPADGKVVVIEEVFDEEYFKKAVRQISIFMSPLNVHINWYPVNGEVTYSKYHKGKYLVAWDPKSSTDNERHSVVIKHPVHGEILVKQIAGAVARRIVNYAKVGDTVSQGQELGFIKFGSRVDLLIPLSAKIDFKLEDISYGGQSIAAYLK